MMIRSLRSRVSMMHPTLLSATVKGLSRLRGGEVAGLVPSPHRRGAQGDEQVVALACAGRADQAQVLAGR
jgi:hypothetical protein